MSSEASDPSFSSAALVTMLEASDEGFIVIDGDERCRLIGRRVGEMFGIDVAAHLGEPCAKVLEACARACDQPEAFLLAVAAPRGATSTVVEVDVRRPLPRTMTCRVVSMASGRVVFLRDITLERAAESSTRQMRARLRALMPYDGLTGLLSQRRLYEELGREHSRSMRAWDSYAVLRVDVDGMKAINDVFGSAAGDQLLEQLARRLEGCVREYDVLARLEEDEFGVLLPGADVVAARAVAERMTATVAGQAFALSEAVARGESGRDQVDGLLQLAEPLLPPERTMTVSVGGALWVPPSSRSAEDTFRRAGNSLRQARNRGAGTIRLGEDE